MECSKSPSKLHEFCNGVCKWCDEHERVPNLSQLSDDEKAALLYHILYEMHSKKLHPELFGAPFWLSSFYKNMQRGEESLKKRGILDATLNPTELAYQILPSENLRKMLKELREEVIKQEARRNTLQVEIDSLKTKIQKLDLRSSFDRIAIPQQMRDYVDKAFFRIDEGSFSEAIMNCYRVSEILVKTLFSFLYPDEKNKVIKHEDKLKRIWTDEEKEKHKYPGIKVIASLMSVVLWYRNKMAAHTEMTPTKEAAKTCITALIQALIEFERLGIRIVFV